MAPSNAAFTVVAPFLPNRSSLPSTCVISRTPPLRACAQTPNKPTSTSISSPQQRALANPQRGAPALFNGPEAVVGVLLAALALLSDFARNFATLISSSRPAVHASQLPVLRACTDELQRTLSQTRQLLDQSQRILNDAVLRDETGEDVMLQMRQCNQRAQQQLTTLQDALRNSSQNVLEQSSTQTDARTELEQMRAQLADKQAAIDSLTEQINRFKSDSQSPEQPSTDKAEPSQMEQHLADDQTNAGGGDPALSEMSLREIKRNLKAEQLALSAEIAQAQVQSEALSQDEVDALDALKREMKAKKDMLKARLRKAQTTVEKEEMNIERRDKAIDDVLHSIGQSPDRADEAKRVDNVEGDFAPRTLSADNKLQTGLQGEPHDTSSAESSADAAKPEMQQQAAVPNAHAMEDSAGAEETGAKKTRTRTRKRTGRSVNGADDSAADTSTKQSGTRTRTRKRGRPPKTAS